MEKPLLADHYRDAFYSALRVHYVIPRTVVVYILDHPNKGLELYGSTAEKVLIALSMFQEGVIAGLGFK